MRFALCLNRFPRGPHPVFIYHEPSDVAMSKGRGIQFADSRTVRKGDGECIVNLPAGLRDAVDIEEGDEVFWVVEDGEVWLRPPSK